MAELYDHNKLPGHAVTINHCQNNNKKKTMCNCLPNEMNFIFKTPHLMLLEK